MIKIAAKLVNIMIISCVLIDLVIDLLSQIRIRTTKKKMKHISSLITTLMAALTAVVAITGCKMQQGAAVAMPEGEFTYNLPCRVMNIHPEQPGKAVLFLWLHGGVHDRSKHNLMDKNHLDLCAADDSIVNYLQRHRMKAIALFPICHKAWLPDCVTWKDCATEVRKMIDDYVSKGLVDPERIYVAGSSDGGTGAWDYATDMSDVFAAAISMSCEEPRVSSMPVYFFSTASEGDCTALVETVKQQGSNVYYKYCPQYRHGGDAAECTDALLKHYFSNTLHKRHNLLQDY
jgi:poly(3-hydroxybutyrate) depolymerase